MKRIFCCLIILGTMATGRAQPSSSYELQFNKDFLSWQWHGNLNLIRPVGRDSRLTLRENFASNLFRDTGQNRKWRDENDLELSWLTPVSRKWSLRTFIRSQFFSDENSVVKFSKHVGGQEVIFTPKKYIRITPALGWTVEDNFGRQDQGFYARLGTQINNLDMGGYLNNTELKSVLRAIPGRRNQSHNLTTGWQRKFSKYARDSIKIGYLYSESRFLINSQRNQEQVIINSRFLSNQLNYKLSDSGRLIIITDLSKRDIDQTNVSLNNRREETRLQNQVHYRTHWKNARLRFGMLTSQTIDDNPGLQTDITGKQTALTSAIKLNPYGKNSIWGAASYTKYEFDTPDTVTNNDDRDELRFIFEGGFRHRFSPIFSASLSGQVYLYHQIFINAERSANNNWNRIFQLTATFDHRPTSRLIHRNRIRILSNFTVFDFEEFFPQIRSFVFRKLIYSDSISYQISPELSFNSFYQLEKEDNGTFLSKKFAEQVTKNLTAHFINIFLQIRAGAGFLFSGGISLVLRDEWNFLPAKRKVRQYRSTTPRVSLLYPAGRRLTLEAVFAPNRTSDFGRNRRSFTTGRLRMLYNF